MPKTPLPAIVAYMDWRRFGVLPYAGGSFQQPGYLMAQLRIVHFVVAEHEEREAKKRQKAHETGRRRK